MVIPLSFVIKIHDEDGGKSLTIFSSLLPVESRTRDPHKRIRINERIILPLPLLREKGIWMIYPGVGNAP